MDTIFQQLQSVHQWSLEVIIASSNPNKVLKPVVHLQLKMNTGEIENLALNLEEFGEFRYKIAEASKILTDVENSYSKINLDAKPAINS